MWEQIETEDAQGTLGLYTAGDSTWTLARITPAGAARMEKIAAEHGPSWRGLGVSILHRLVIGELLGARALGDPAGSRLFRWRDGERVVSDGPYAEGKEHLAGFFLIDVDSQERAEEIAGAFGVPGETIELRPVMGGGGDVD